MLVSEFRPARSPWKLFPLLLVYSCWAPGGILHSGPEPETPEQWFSRRWVGQPEDELFVHFGKPKDVIQLSTGNFVDSYHREDYQASASSVAFRGSGGGSSSASTAFCDRRFEIDKATSKVVRAVVIGDCDVAQ